MENIKKFRNCLSLHNGRRCCLTGANRKKIDYCLKGHCLAKHAFFKFLFRQNLHFRQLGIRQYLHCLHLTSLDIIIFFRGINLQCSFQCGFLQFLHCPHLVEDVFLGFQFILVVCCPLLWLGSELALIDDNDIVVCNMWKGCEDCWVVLGLSWEGVYQNICEGVKLHVRVSCQH